MVVGDESTGPLNVGDAKAAVYVGLDVDFEAIPK